MAFVYGLIRVCLEVIAFLVLTIMLFNEFIALAQVIGFFNEQIIPQLGSVSIILASLNLISKSFFGLRLFEN